MKYIIGLGNPGKKYEQTRHNIGFFFLDQLCSEWRSEAKFHAEFSLGTNWTWVKPQTFMNLSGDSVQKIVNFYKLDPKKDILIISDDIDMEFGKVRFRKKWSHGGQNGLRDIIEKLGTDEFSRIKIGIWRNPNYSVSDWVLSRFTPEEKEILHNEVWENVKQKIKEWLDES
jgi:PTH1 family peptidyl-tRNA hydrolase